MRQRYLVQQVLGQGGFGRTYLAYDLERFKEPCVLKELVPPHHNQAVWEKSKVLFQREASTLYQLHHPQIPRFWGAFEDNQRLFLVEDFINGKTYRQLLEARLQQGRVFREAEVLYLLSQLVPVLNYIHNRRIIHRDISPENIMLQVPRTNAAQGLDSRPPNKGLPVLIDFGAVKAVASYWSSGMTRVGKVGYSPPEQLQTGKAYPHSDLYALGVTCLVLLTGQEPETLLDSQNLLWCWRDYVNLSDRFSLILERMLAWHPGDRYQTTKELFTDLQPLLKRLQAAPTRRSVPPMPLPPTQARYSRLSRRQSRFHWTQVATNPSFLMALGLTCMGLTLGVSWLKNNLPTQEMLVSQAKLSVSEPSPPFNSSYPASNLTAIQSSSANTPRRIDFAPGEISSVLQGNLQQYTLQPYLLKGVQGQIITVTLQGTGVIMNLLRSNQQGIDASAYQTRSWTGQLPVDDDYVIQVLGTGSYSLEVAMTPTSRSIEMPTQRVKFARGTTGTTVTGDIAPNQLRTYLLKAKAGQMSAIKVLQGEVNLSVISPTGDRIGGSTSVPNWQGRLPLDGDYAIEVSANQPGQFAISLEIY